MTKEQIQYLCNLGHSNSYRKRMLDTAIAKRGLEQLLVINDDGTFSGIPRSALYDKCFAMFKDKCFYIDKDSCLSNLVLPFPNKVKDLPKEDKAAAIAYAEAHGIMMPKSLRNVFDSRGFLYCGITLYAMPYKSLFQTDKEKEYIAAVLSEVIDRYSSAFVYENPIYKKDICDEIVYRYNKKILNNMVFSENIKNYPENSPVLELAAYAFCKTDVIGRLEHRSSEIWAEENITPSMKTDDLKLLKVVTAIKRPLFERDPGNKTPYTFDTIRVWFSLISRDVMPERNDFIKENRRGFSRLALARIHDDKRCQIPVNLLKIDHIGITSQSQLEFIFTLKDEVTAAFEH